MKAQDLKIFMRQSELKMEQKALWVLILTWADKDGTGAFPTQETLSQISGKSERWVKRTVAVLKKKGYLVIDKDRKLGAKYLHNKYSLKTRGHHGHPGGGHQCHLTKSLYQNSDSLAVESEAILRVVRG